MNAIDWLLQMAYILLIISLACALYRVIRGPSLPDRIVALDLIAMIIAGFTTVYAIETQLAVYLDVVLILAIVLFFGTVAFGRYLQRKVKT